MATSSNGEGVGADGELTKPSFLRRVRIRGYKSIAFCDVTLEPLTILVGRNASGKSNFFDALAFLRDVMDTSASDAVRHRGGWSAVACRSSPSQSIEIEVTAGLTCEGPDSRVEPSGPADLTATAKRAGPDLTGFRFTAVYGLQITGGTHSPTAIGREKLEIFDKENQRNGGFELRNGAISGWWSEPDFLEPLSLLDARDLRAQLAERWIHVARPDQTLLSVRGEQPFIDLGDGLRWMGFYNFHPDAVRALQRPSPGWLLERDGRNLASVIESVKEIDPSSVDRVRQYLAAIAEQVEGFDVAHYGEYETVRFRQSSHGDAPLEFDAAAMSDGTLRALACLMAAFQIHLPSGPSVVGIEEPETALHPAATRALAAALDEATLRTQILLTTQSPELLDYSLIRPRNIRVVQMVDGRTTVGPVDEAGVEIVRRELNTLGGLERDNQLVPDLDDLDRQKLLGRALKSAPP